MLRACRPPPTTRQQAGAHLRLCAERNPIVRKAQPHCAQSATPLCAKRNAERKPNPDWFKRHCKGPNIGKLSGNPKGKKPSDAWAFPNVKNNHPEKTALP